MKFKHVSTYLTGTLLAATLVGCSSATENTPSQNTNSSVKGKLANVSVSGVGTLAAKTITHIMAVSPSTTNSEKYVSEVAADGTFSLGINSGKPYIIVFVAQDGSLTGPDMIAGIVKAGGNDLDTLPLAQAGSVDLGDVTISGEEAQPSTSIADLLSALGVTSAEATQIGAVDNLALRLANPDVDGNGTIDALEDKQFDLTWHVRATTLLDGVELTMTDIKDSFPDATKVTLDWSGAGAYVVYPDSYDSTEYVNSGTGALQNSGGFATTGTLISPPSNSYWMGTFSDRVQWGPNYDMTSGEIGASDSVSVFEYSLGSKKLTFSNVETKTKAQLNADGTILPFIKVNTSADKITGVDYKWMKLSGGTWVAATTTELALLVQEDSARLMLYTQKGGGIEYGLSFNFPISSASGTVNIGDANSESEGVADPTNVAVTDICNSALSYDDNIGLRIFAGSAAPTSGSPCN